MSWRPPGKVAAGMLPPGAAFGKGQSSKSGTIQRVRRCGQTQSYGSGPMTILKWALIFFLVSIVAGILGFTGVSAASADVARFLFYVFVVIFLVLLILGLTIFRV
jgi:uncharacterized membrane protein YtjA (UPF0391 family)